MRISDWSSDVCSSDLAVVPEGTADRALQSASLARAVLLVQHGAADPRLVRRAGPLQSDLRAACHAVPQAADRVALALCTRLELRPEIGRASCRERVCQYV